MVNEPKFIGANLIKDSIRVQNVNVHCSYIPALWFLYIDVSVVSTIKLVCQYINT